MASILMDISTGKVIESLNAENSEKRPFESGKPVMEISAPDGRKVFSIIGILKIHDRANQSSALLHELKNSISVPPLSRRH